GTRVHYVDVVRLNEATGLVAKVYAQIRSDFLLGDPFALHSTAPEVLAASWAMVRETLVVGQVTRGFKEAVASAVSRTNACPYCVEVHDSMERASRGEDHDTYVPWAEATRRPRAEVLAFPPFSAEQAPEVIGVAVAFHYLNRMVNVFLEESPMPAPQAAKGLLEWVSSPMLRRAAAMSPAPGTSLELLEAADLPEDMVWASGRPEIASAFGAAIEDAAAPVLSEAVRTHVRERLTGWWGEDRGLERWVEKEVADLPPRDQPDARLVYLTALAPYRVDDPAIAAFRERHPEDGDLIAATAWGSLTAARRIGGWLKVPAE
ncbi:MAG: carboxymuconolactone decarboxylase family protein, partial [Deltaproteobacteria bacterium]|nr:carboxymuconolactone decarboxylase family protein [Deltaproteobacteria bacterium]